MTVTFEKTTTLEATAEIAFDLSLDVDFHKESFRSTGEQIVDGVKGGSMQLGETVRWRAKHFGVWWEMTSAITELDRPKCFVDQQVNGPFKRFWHLHEFQPLDDGTTLLRDRVEFDAPLGPLGIVAERVFLRRYLEKLIELRNAELVLACRRRS